MKLRIVLSFAAALACRTALAQDAAPTDDATADDVTTADASVTTDDASVTTDDVSVTTDDASVTTDAAGDAAAALDPRWHSVRVLRGDVMVRAAPDVAAARRGTLASGSRLPVLDARPGPGCTGPWVRIAEESWVCSDRTQWREDAPAAQEQPVVTGRDAMPFRYATTTHANTRAWRRVEDVGDNTATPARLDRNMTLAVRATRNVDGHTYAETADGRWIALADLMWTALPPHRPTGHTYQANDGPGALAFAAQGARAWPDSRSAVHGTVAVAGSREIQRHEVVRVTEERLVGGVRVLRTERGWVQAAYLARPDVPAAPSDVGATERWVDVDRARQVMVAFEGTHPVWAALVSTGRPDHATAPGTFRVRVKMADDDMTNVGATGPGGEAPTDRYFVARVPWVMYFHGGTAFHAAFWHDDFGRVRSHGCVNMAPEDARWLFRWAPPAMPPGWTTALPSPRDPGMRVRVR